jgi:hypothetical protein
MVVENAVKHQEAKKETVFGKANNYLFKFCGTFAAHSDLFCIFFQGDKYTCLFIGVLSSIVKVSSELLWGIMANTLQAFARHNEIVEGFSRPSRN